jgi:hypothetical protein
MESLLFSHMQHSLFGVADPDKGSPRDGSPM